MLIAISMAQSGSRSALGLGRQERAFSFFSRFTGLLLLACCFLHVHSESPVQNGNIDYSHYNECFLHANDTVQAQPNTSFVSLYDAKYVSRRCQRRVQDEQVLRCQETFSYRSLSSANFVGQDNAAARIYASDVLATLLHFCKQKSSIDPLKLSAFFCALYFPPCSAQPVVPCRELCYTIRKECKSAMDLMKYVWPVQLRCTNFPSFASAAATTPVSASTVTTDTPIAAGNTSNNSLPVAAIAPASASTSGITAAIELNPATQAIIGENTQSFRANYDKQTFTTQLAKTTTSRREISSGVSDSTSATKTPSEIRSSIATEGKSKTAVELDDRRKSNEASAARAGVKSEDKKQTSAQVSSGASNGELNVAVTSVSALFFFFCSFQMLR